MRLFLQIRSRKYYNRSKCTRYSICDIDNNNKVNVLFRGNCREELRVHMSLLGMKFHENSDSEYFDRDPYGGGSQFTVYFWVPEEE